MEEITKQSFVQKLMKAASEAINLKIRTIVGPIALEDDKISTKVDAEDAANTKAMMTQINLLDGDITTKMDEDFASGPYQSLRSFHQEQQDKGDKIIQNNIAVIKELLEMVNDLFKDE